MDPLVAAWLAFWLPVPFPIADAAAPMPMIGPPAPAAIHGCADDMVLVEHDHSDEIDHQCIDQRGKHCFAYQPGVTERKGAIDHVRVCMDRYEAPNRKGVNPIVMLSGTESQQWCADHGKRLCSEGEWESACEGDQALPYAYGWKVDTEACDSGKPWRAFDEKALASSSLDIRTRESNRLWQGEPSGARASCVSHDGLFDMTGNVEEWVTSRNIPERMFRMALMGGFWAKPWTGCRGTNDAHSQDFRFYEVGFRCCKDPSP